MRFLVGCVGGMCCRGVLEIVLFGDVANLLCSGLFCMECCGC